MAAMTEVSWDARVQHGRELAEAALARIPVPPAVTPQPEAGDPYRGIEDTAALQQAIYAHRARQLVQVVKVTRPGSEEADEFDREISYRREWMRTVGRPFDARELRGAPAPGCAACERMAGLPCDEHERKVGDPIPLPPHPWPSEQPGHYPGAIHIPYNVLNSVR